MRGATDEPISPEIEHAAAQRTVRAHAGRGYCGPACAADPSACTQIGWALQLLADQGERDQAATVAVGQRKEHVMPLHVVDASTITGKWRKSSRSSSNGACVEVCPVGDEIAMRNSREPEGPALLLTIPEIRAFVEGAKAGEFDSLYLRQ